jgi:hypothetical protein
MNTLLLDPIGWDLMLDSTGNIAMASNPYAIAQDVASAVKLFLGELHYNTNKGLPYFEDIFGKSNPEAILKSQAEIAALTVPEVVQAKCTVLSINNRVMSGTLEIIDATGALQNVSF